MTRFALSLLVLVAASACTSSVPGTDQDAESTGSETDPPPTTQTGEDTTTGTEESTGPEETTSTEESTGTDETSGDGDGDEPDLSYDPPTNVVFISVDDLSAGRLPTYGHEVVQAPSIEALAEESLVFERAYAQVPICTSSRTSIFTGVRPQTSGLYGLEHDWQAAIPGAATLMRHFADNGFATEAVGKLMDTRSGEFDYPDSWAGGGPPDADLPIERLQELHEGGEPFFLAVGFGQPHPVHWSSAENRVKYQDFIDLYPGPLPLEGPIEWNDAGLDTQGALSTYYGVVSWVDNEIGRLIQELKDLGLWDDTMVIVWAADHGYRVGEATNEPGQRWGKWWPDEASSRIPLLIRVPGSPSVGERTAGLVEAIDMYPMLVDMMELSEPPQALEGHTFAQLFMTPDRAWRDAAFTAFSNSAGVVTERYRYIDSWQGPELFDLDVDPKGVVNIADANPELVEEYQALLDAGPDPGWLPD